MSSVRFPSITVAQDQMVSRCMTSNTKEYIAIALGTIVLAGLAFLAHYHYDQAWSSFHCIVPLAAAGAGLICLAVKVYREWGVKEYTYEVSDFTKTMSEYNPDFYDTTIGRMSCFHNHEEIGSHEKNGDNETQRKLVNSFITTRFNNDEQLKVVKHIVTLGQFSCFKDLGIDLARQIYENNDIQLSPSSISGKGAKKHPIEFNFIDGPGEGFVELTCQLYVVDPNQGERLAHAKTHILINLNTNHARCTHTFTPLKHSS